MIYNVNRRGNLRLPSGYLLVPGSADGIFLIGAVASGAGLGRRGREMAVCSGDGVVAFWRGSQLCAVCVTVVGLRIWIPAHVG